MAFPNIGDVYTTRPALTGAQSADVLSLAFAPGGDDDSAALADLFANLGSRVDSSAPRSAAAAELHAAFLSTAADRLS
ncbi:hypothetical protein ACFV2D_04935 [Streptomyces capillispiralis]|uniref:hypothetical protein n=1 Tax=Streptomyces capillispiralis TaxID=68182 RepID=UPI0036B44D5B